MRFFLPATGWIILSTFLLLLPGSQFPKQNWTHYIPLFDKWVHIGMFSIMVLLLCWGFYKIKENTLAKTFFWIFIVCFCFGIAIEFIQREFIPFRSFDIGDIVADGVGCLAGYWYSLRKYVKR